MNDQERAVLAAVVGNQAVMLSALAVVVAYVADNVGEFDHTDGMDTLLLSLTERAELSFGLRDAMQGAEDAAD